MELTKLTEELGKTKYEGSSMDIGTSYQDIPGTGIPFHRGDSEKRSKRISEIVDLKDKDVVDLGCSVGSVLGGLQKYGVKSITGIDHDPASIRVAQNIYNSTSDFVCKKIDTNLFKEYAHNFDVAIWTSQFMWMVNQRGIEYALDFLYELSKNIPVLVFETAGRDDGSAPLDLDQEDIMELLCKNTVYQDIRDCGPWGDNWANRHVFVCKSPRTSWPWKDNGVTKVDRINRHAVRKTFMFNENPRIVYPHIQLLMDNEIRFAGGYKYFPTIVGKGQNWIDYEYAGPPTMVIPDRDRFEILGILQKHNIIHRDINPSNLLWNGKHLILIDFSHAIYRGEKNVHHHHLNRRYRSPYGHDDDISFQISQRELMDNLGANK